MVNYMNWCFNATTNQIPYDYTVEVRNSFKRLDLKKKGERLDLIECLMNNGWRFVTF